MTSTRVESIWWGHRSLLLQPPSVAGAVALPPFIVMPVDPLMQGWVVMGGRRLFTFWPATFHKPTVPSIPNLGQHINGKSCSPHTVEKSYKSSTLHSPTL